MLRRLSQGVYGACVPSGRRDGTERFLEDVWRQAPAKAAATHTVMAIVISVLPPLVIGRWRLFASLPQDERDRMILAMLRSRFYPLRLLASAVKGTALMAALREPLAREELLPSRPEETPSARRAVPAPSDYGGRVDAWPAAKSSAWDHEVDYVVVGTGAAGSVAASSLAQARGGSVLMLEEGRWLLRDQFGADLYSSVSRLFRAFGTQTARGPSVIPVLQGCCVGGSTVISGAVMHRLPRPVFEQWRRDPALASRLSFEKLEAHAARLEAALGVRANVEAVLPSLPVSAALRRLGWSHEAMQRAAPSCQETGRCLQGCPSGGKLSMESSFVPEALAAGAELWTNSRVARVLLSRARAEGVLVHTPLGSRRVRARKAVVLAAGAVHSPALLARSGLRSAHLGRHFQCHLGVAVAALLDKPTRELEGPPQGVEVTQFAGQGVKLATQLVPPELLLARSPVAGREMMELLRRCERITCWTGSVRSQAEGCVSLPRVGAPSVRFAPSRHDLERLRDAVRWMAELLLELGAVTVFPNVFGAPERIQSRAQLEALREAPLDPRSYHIGVGHLFGTCRMGGDPRASVVGPDFAVHGARGLYVVDASVFPTNIGTNPQLAIMSMAAQAAEEILA